MSSKILTICALLVIICLAPTKSYAGDIPANAWGFLGAGYKHTITHNEGGLDLRVGLGVGIGPMGLEFETGSNTDNSFASVDSGKRLALRTQNWLNVRVRIPIGPVGLAFGFGGGLGWIKPPGKAEEVGGRHPSQGIHEYVAFDLPISEAMSIAIRVEPQHLWQKEVLPGVDHNIVISGYWTLTIRDL